MTLYNLTEITNSTTGLLSFTQGVNTFILNDWLGFMILVSITMVVFSSYMFSTGGDLKKTIVGTAFVSFILAFFLRILSLAGDKVFFGTLIICAAAVAFFWND